ncbi:MAG: energy transducer TonB [Proteobacteria bacterium]|nr:energy transducer TonB [Burkholderiales bacterium]
MGRTRGCRCAFSWRSRFNAAYLDNPKPVYPAEARRIGEQGTVLLRVYVSAIGTPERIQAQRSSGSARLDEAANEAVRGWKFVPAMRGPEPVSAWVTVPITFTLK